jgi:hypothetical protein
MFSRTSCALLLVCSLFISCEAVTQTITVPLLLGESENRIANDANAVPFLKNYTAKPHDGVTTTAQASNILLTITPSQEQIEFSRIVITNIPVNVTAAHIHGPCADATPCSNGAVVYTICSPCPASMNGTITIDGFQVGFDQLNGGVLNYSTVFGLYQGIMYSNKLYYLNFHTAR